MSILVHPQRSNSTTLFSLPPPPVPSHLSSEAYVDKALEIIKTNALTQDFDRMDIQLKAIQSFDVKKNSTETIYKLIEQIKDSTICARYLPIIYRHLIINLSLPYENVEELSSFNEEFRIEIAKQAVQQNAWALSRNFKSYVIKDEQARIEIAQLATRQNAAAISQFIQNYAIENEQERIAIAKLAAQQNGWALSAYIENFAIEDEKGLIEIAKLAAQQNGHGTSEYIDNYQIKNEKARAEIARIAMVQNSTETVRCLNNYHLSMEDRVLLFVFVFHALPDDAFDIYAFFPDVDEALKHYPELRLFGRTDDFDIGKFLFDFWEVEQIPLAMISKLHTQYLKIAKEKDSNKKDADLQWLKFYCSVLDFAKDCPPLREKLTILFDQLETENNLRVKFKKIYWLSSLFLSMRAQKIDPKILCDKWPLFENILELRDPALRSDLLKYLIDSLIHPTELKLTADPVTVQLAWLVLASCSKKITPYIELEIHKRTKKEKLCKEIEVPDFELTHKIISFPTQVQQLLSQKYFKDQEQMKSLLHSLVVLMQTTLLTHAQKRSILRDLIFVKDNNLKGNAQSKQILYSAHNSALLINCKEQHRLIGIKTPLQLQDQIKELFLSTLHLGIADFNKKFLATFGSWRKSNAFFIYVGKMCALSQEDKDKIFPYLKIYAEGVLNGTFKETRYATGSNASEHMRKLYAQAPELLNAWKQRVYFPEFSYKNYTIMDTDDSCDLLLAGTEVGSCQKVDGDPNKSKCLLSYLLDGKIRMMAIKNKDGVTVARCMLRLLWDKSTYKFVLFQEHIYPHNTREEFIEILDKACFRRAKQLGISLAVKKQELQGDKTTLEAFRGKIPFEYVDALGTNSIQSDTGYEIENCSYITHTLQ